MMILVATGLAFGSFGTVLIDRIPEHLPLKGRSRCTRCKKMLHWWELIPIVSFVYLRRKCGSCAHPIAWWYPFVEGGSALVFVYSWFVTPDLITAPSLALALWILWIIAWIDIRAQAVPDILTIVFFVFVFAYSLLQGHLDFGPPLVAVGFFGLQWALSRGHLLGSGDLFITGTSGFLFGNWQGIVLAIFWAYISGAIFCILALLFGWRKITDRIAFIPFWFCGVILSLLSRGSFLITNIF